MAGPWEKYKSDGPWTRYAAKPDFSNVEAENRSTEDPSALDEIGRAASLFGRSALRGVYDLSGALGGDFLGQVEARVRNHFREPTLSGLITGQDAPVQATTSRDAADFLADQLGLATPANGAERVSADVSSALVGGGGVMSVGRNLATRGLTAAQRGIGSFLSSTPLAQVGSMVGGSSAASTTREAGGGQGAQLAAGLIGGLSPAAISTGGQSGLRGLIRGGEAGREAFNRNLADFRSVGAQPSVGQAAGNFRTQGLESLLAGGPTSSGVMARFAERQADDIGTGLQSLGTRLSPKAGAEQAGRAIERGVDTFANNTKAMRRALYWQVDQHIPETTPLALSRTQMALADLTQPNPGAQATTGGLINPRIAQIAQNVADDMAANGGSLPYSAVKELRSRIGEELSDFALSADRPTAQYKRLYAALSQDLEEAARKQGPAAEAAARRANNYMRASADRLEQIQRVVDKNGGPEAVFNAAMSGTRDGATTLRAVMQSLPDDGQRALTGAVVKRMGLATPGNQDAEGAVFSAQTFLTKWNGLAPEAKKALFNRHGPKFAADMDKVARVASNLRDGSRVFANPSGTANKAAAYTYWASLPAASAASVIDGGATLAGLVLGGIAGNVGARAMTNPKVVNWLARATELPASALPQQLIVLDRIAKEDEGAADLAAAIRSSGQSQQAP